MTFVKHFNSRGGNGRKEKMVGSAVFGDGKLAIRLPNTKTVVEGGITSEGFGVITKDAPARKSPYTTIITKYDVNDLPIELRGTSYKFRIMAEHISENEYVFPFTKAKMITKK